LQQAEQGVLVAELCRKPGVSEQAFYRWKKKFDEMTPSENDGPGPYSDD
jgi:putative transposase